MTERLGPPPHAMPRLRPADVHKISAGQFVGRVFFAAGPHPAVWDSFRNFGPVASMRFDHHPAPTRVHPVRAIAYAAPSQTSDGRAIDPLETCVLECFSSTRTIDTRFNEPWFVLWRAARPIPVLDMVDSAWIVRAGGNAAISSGARSMARRWSKAVYRAYPSVAGIYFESSNLPSSRGVALYERAQSALPPRYDAAFPLTHPLLRSALRRIAHQYAFNLVL